MELLTKKGLDAILRSTQETRARSDPHPRRGADPAEVQEKVIIERAAPWRPF